MVGKQTEDRRREVTDDLDDYHQALVNWLIPDDGTGDDGTGDAPGWWRGDDDAASTTMAGIRARTSATSPGRRRPVR